MRRVSQEPRSKPAEPAELENCLLTLLQEIQKHVGGAGARLPALDTRFKETESPRELVKSAIEALGHYGTKTSHATLELAKAIQTLSGMQGNTERWTRVEDQIKAISPKDNLEVTKARLCAEVAMARAEALQERQKIGTLFSGIISKLHSHEAEPGEGKPAEDFGYRTDQLTGLPTRAYAEGELMRAHAQLADCYLALFVVKRLALINAKFGYTRGDEVLLRVVSHLAQSMPDYKNLFRWAPCAFLNLAPAGVPYKDLRTKVQIIELARLTPTLEWEGRSAMVPVVMDCRIMSVKDFTTPSDLFMRLDALAVDT
jgi:GGDEF domain-containing protein